MYLMKQKEVRKAGPERPKGRVTGVKVREVTGALLEGFINHGVSSQGEH